MNSLKDIIAIGKQHFDNRNYSRAEEHLRRAVELNPALADVHNMLGVISHVEGKFSESIDRFRHALKINPNYTEAALNLAVLYNDLGRYSEARRIYERLRSRSAKAPAKVEPVLRGKLSNLHADIGDIYRSIGLFEMAVDEYRKALSLNPTYIDIRTRLGQALREGGRLKDSAAELSFVLKSNAKYAPALIQLGVTRYASGKPSEAKHCWKRALKCAPDNPYAEMYLRLCAATERTQKSGNAPKGGGKKGKSKGKARGRGASGRQRTKS